MGSRAAARPFRRWGKLQSRMPGETAYRGAPTEFQCRARDHQASAKVVRNRLKAVWARPTPFPSPTSLPARALLCRQVRLETTNAQAGSPQSSMRPSGLASASNRPAAANERKAGRGVRFERMMPNCVWPST